MKIKKSHTFAHMDKQFQTAAEAVNHFAANVWPHLFRKERTTKNKEYGRAYLIIADAKSGSVSPKRAAWLLETYGGGSYQVGTTFNYTGSEIRA